MLASRILGGVGRTMISAGVLILMFVSYQLWGTGLRTDQSQSNLRDGFSAQVDEMKRSTGVSTPPGVIDGSGQSAAGSSFSLADLAKDPKVQAYAKNKKYRWGESIGKITIPRIGADFWMVEGVELSLLAEGPGHFPSTAMPGQPGNAALAGHRTTWKAPFNRIDELSPGDRITIETLQGRFTYEVIPGADGTGHRIVPPTDVSILDNKGDNRLTLMACHPKYSAAQRIVVSAKLIDNPAEVSPRSEPPPGFKTDEAIAKLGSDEPAVGPSGAPGAGAQTAAREVAALTAGDDSARRPAVAYGLGAGLLWLAVILLGHFFKRVKWPAYAIALAPFGFLLWHCFENINRALPAAY